MDGACLVERRRPGTRRIRRCAVRSAPGGTTPFDETVILEIRAAEGGADAAEFARQLVRMYQKAAQRQGHRCQLLRSQPAPGGIRMAVLAISGAGAWDWWAPEAGVHRIQRVPPTEKRGRRHTSAVSVAVLHAAQVPDLASAEVVGIDPREIVVETMRASGNGGQHLNKTESAVRIRHLPTGITVVCQDERSQHQNRLRALRVLQERLAELSRRRAGAAYREAVRRQVGTGARAEHHRTYNFIDGFVSDSRTGIRTQKLRDVLDGRLDLLR